MEKRSAPQRSFGSFLTVAQREWGGEWTPARAGIGAATLLLAALLILAPLPYGAVLPGGHVLVQTLSFVAAAIAFICRPAGRVFGISALPLIAVAAVAILGVLQLVPMSIATLESISPASAEVYQRANEVLNVFERAPIRPRISIAPESTVTGILLTVSFVAVFIAAAIVGHDRTARRVLVGSVLGASAVHIIVVTAAGYGSGRISGSFINPNNFAGYLQIALAFAFGMVWREILLSRTRAAGEGDIGKRFEKRAVPMILWILLWAVIATGIGFTRSRGGILAAAITTVVLLVLAPLHRRGRAVGGKLAIGGLVAILAGTLFLAFVAGEAPLLRFLDSDPQDIGSDERVKVWRASLDAWHRAPIAGTGLGTFREAFRPMQPPDVRGLVEHAHNDFLQILVTGGWVGAGLAATGYGLMIVILVAGWISQQHREESALALAAIGALIAIALHGLVDFNLSIPAIPITLSAMTGVGWAAARTE